MKHDRFGSALLIQREVLQLSFRLSLSKAELTKLRTLLRTHGDRILPIPERIIVEQPLQRFILVSESATIKKALSGVEPFRSIG
jgi:hypothetical protein